MKKKFKLILLSFFILFILIFFFQKQFHENFVSYLTFDQRQTIKKYFFPYKFINQLQSQLKLNDIHYKELEFKNNNTDIRVIRDIKLQNDKILKIYNLKEGFYSGIHENNHRSGYIDFHNNSLFVLSSKGTLAYSKNFLDDLYLKKIKNNIENFISINQFKKHIWFSIKDLLITNDKIYVSYTEEIKDDCWNTSLIHADLNYNEITFKKLFSSKYCIDSRKINNEEFNAHQSGGRIIKFDKNNVLLTTGDYRQRFYAQDKNSVNGKILKININNSNYEIISMGHRNPQGLYLDTQKNIILETEHGPMGGDEVNLIEISKIDKKNILNYGWAVVSAGEHYGGKVEKNNSKYKKYPLYKSHSKYGFIEPLKSFVPSIAISEIVKIGNSKYAFGSMGKDRSGDMSIYFFDLDDQNKLKNLKSIKVYERVRDLKFKDGKLYLFLENTGSIGVLSLN